MIIIIFIVIGLWIGMLSWIVHDLQCEISDIYVLIKDINKRILDLYKEIKS